MKETEIESIYLHVCNSGVKISVVDGGMGPVIKIKIDAFGALNSEMKFFVTSDGLKALTRLFERASYYKYSEAFSGAARQLDNEKLQTY